MVGGLLWDLLMPAVCPGCQQHPGPALCASCRQDIAEPPNACRWCATPMPAQATSCHHCYDSGLPNLQRIQAAAIYTGVMETLIRDGKVGARSPALKALAQWAASHASIVGRPTVVPIPPNPGRRDGRHLATTCAQAIAARHGLNLGYWLRTTRTAALQHELAAPDRKRAVDGLFAARQISISGQVLLVDDIMTSGSTLIAAARTLRQAGASRVHAFCLARTPRRDDPRPPKVADG